MDYNRFLTTFFRTEKADMLSVAERQLDVETKMISLAVGIPNQSVVPIRSAKFHCSDEITLDVDEKTMMNIAPYQSPKGMPKLVDFVTKVHEKYHSPPLMNDSDSERRFDVCITTGAMGGIHLFIPMFTEKGDVILMEEFSFPGALRNVKIRGAIPLGVAMDDKGIIPSSLRSVLENWKEEARKNVEDEAMELKAPKVLYTVSSVHNPTGATVPLERKKEVYKIAQEYDLIIIEDDSFFYLQCFDNFVPSFQSLDTDGRVLRIDSTSKFVAPGVRIGWITGPATIIRRAMEYQRTDAMAPASFSQIALIKLFNEWGLEGFERNFKKIQAFYKSRIKQTDALLRKYLSEYLEWSQPTGGFFFWLKLTKHKDSSFLGEESIAKQYGVSVVPGTKFSSQNKHVGSYIRLGFSYEPMDVIEEGIKRLKKLLDDFPQTASP